MNMQDFQREVVRFFTSCRETLAAKGEDYSTPRDAYDHVCRIAELTGSKPEAVMGVLLAKHIVSVMGFLARGDTSGVTQTLRECCQDGANYLAMIAVYCEDQEESRRPHANDTAPGYPGEPSLPGVR